MSTLSAQPMSFLHVEVEELYQRHLCRHSQFGNNIIHLLALIGVWASVYGAIHWLIPSPWPLIGLGISYLLVIASNLSLRLLVPTTLVVAGIVAMAYYIPVPYPWGWIYLILIPVFYKIQLWGHKLYTIENDMTEFNRKYPKGRLLFFVLLFYDLPVILQFLLFGRRDWR